MGFGRVPGAICQGRPQALSCSFLGFVLLPVVAAALLSESESPSRLSMGVSGQKGLLPSLRPH